MKFRKKQVIEAVQITEAWFTGEHPNPLHVPGVIIDSVNKTVTLKGDPTLSKSYIITLTVGAWLILGEAKTYAMSDDKFRALYEEII